MSNQEALKDFDAFWQEMIAQSDWAAKNVHKFSKESFKNLNILTTKKTEVFGNSQTINTAPLIRINYSNNKIIRRIQKFVYEFNKIDIDNANIFLFGFFTPILVVILIWLISSLVITLSFFI